MKILYVEDNPRDADLTRRWMQKRAPQFTLETVATQSDAVARLNGREAAQPYDLVLTDLQLPDGDGLSLLSYIRERALPLAVVVITGTGDEEMVVAALKARADDYVAKRNDYLERLPLTLESALRRHRAQAARQIRPLRVLYAEPHHADADLTRRHLQRYAPHIQLDVAPTGDAALALLPQAGAASRYDVILLDYRLPGMNALEALQELRQERGLDIPVVLITGQGDEELAAQALKLGAASYIVKNSGYLHQLPNELENAHYRAEILREEAALRASEERFAKAFHSNPQPMSITTLAEGRYVDVNECFVKMSGYARAEIIGHTSIERNVWGSQEVRAEFVRQLQEQGAIRNLETRFRTKGGGIRILLSSAELIELSGKHCILMSSSDITERKQTEQALRESEERFRLAQRAAQAGTWGWNVLTGELSWSEGIYSLLGLEQGDGKSTVEEFGEFIHPEDREKVLNNFRSTIKGGEYFDDEFRIIRRDGAVAWLASKGRVIRNATARAEWIIGINIDISERKQAELALGESEERFHRAFDHAAIGMALVAPNGSFLQVNRSVCQMLGYTRPELLATDFQSLTHPDDLEADLASVRGVLAGELQTYQMEKRYFHKEGRIVWALLSVSLLRDSHGQPLYFISQIQDVTERKQAAQALCASEERFRLAQGAARVGAWSWNIPTGESSWSEGIYSLLGVEQGDGQASVEDFIESIHTEDRERVMGKVQSVIADGEYLDDEFRIIRPDGAILWLASKGRVVRNAAGLAEWMTGINIDITERKRAEAALAEKELRLREAQAIAHVGSFHWDVADNTVAWSDELYRIYGLQPGVSNITLETYIQHVHPDHQQQVRQAVERALTNREPFEHEYRIVRLTGETRWVFARCQPVFHAGGHLLALQGICQDITERKWAEAELRRSNQELQASNAALRDTSEELAGKKEEVQAVNNQLQAVNKELQAVNVELETNLTELGRVNSDLHNLITSTQIGTIFLDRALHIKRYTPPIRKLFNIPPSDINRPIEHLTPQFDYADLQADAQRVLAESIIVEHEVRNKDGHWYIMRLLPYRTDEDKVDGVVVTFVEITERKLIEERMRRFFELPLVGMAITTPDRRFSVVNQKLCDMLGYSAEELTGMTWADVTHPEDIAENARLLEQTVKGEADGYLMDKRYIHRQGHVVYTSISARCVRREDGAVDHLLLIVQDITERKQAEQSLRASESRYRALFEKASDAILLVTEQDEILEVNQEACNLLGYSRAELLALKVSALQAPEMRGRVGKVVSRGLDKQRDVRFESVGLHRDGKKIPVEITSTLVEEGERKLVLSFVRDITERKRIERQKHEQITSIVETETQQNNFARIIGQSPALHEMIRTAEKVAGAEISPVLITGETGVGKGMIARAIHYASRRASFAFSHIDCASIPETLFESELFGNEQGAFTDARKSRRGRLELAKNGTVFLDEISEIPLNLQAKLLQLLQDGTFHRIGGREEITLNARVIAATNRNLRAEVAAGRFRADLYQRLFVVQIDVPPLRARAGDALLLAGYFMAVYNKKYGKNIRQLAPQAAEALSRYPWPGNVRELEHAIERAVLFEESEQITLKHLRLESDVTVEPPPNEIAAATPAPTGAANGTLDQINETIIKQMVEDCNGNITQAARRLGVSRSRIYRVLQGTNHLDTSSASENMEEEATPMFVN